MLHKTFLIHLKTRLEVASRAKSFWKFCLIVSTQDLLSDVFGLHGLIRNLLGLQDNMQEYLMLTYNKRWDLSLIRLESPKTNIQCVYLEKEIR